MKNLNTCDEHFGTKTREIKNTDYITELFVKLCQSIKNKDTKIGFSHVIDVTLPTSCTKFAELSIE